MSESNQHNNAYLEEPEDDFNFKQLIFTYLNKFKKVHY